MSALIQGLASFFASKEAARGQRRALSLQERMYGTARRDLAPYREAGGIGLEGLQALLKDPSSFASDPAYQFAREEGLRGLTQRAAAGGTLQSGGTLRDIVAFSSGLATQGYNARVGQFQNLASMGQNAAVQTGNIAQNYAQSAGGIMQNIGNIRAAGILGVSNAMQQGTNTALTLAQLSMGMPPATQGAVDPRLNTEPGTYY